MKRSSHTRERRFKAKSSRQRRYLLLALSLCSLPGLLALLSSLGTWLSFPLALAILWALTMRCWNDPAEGLLLRWRSGSWVLSLPLEETEQAVCLRSLGSAGSFLHCLHWQQEPGHSSGVVLVYADSLARDDARQLRALLRIAR
ncbi:MAG: hypothetical protein AAGI11_12495 [Pseudomonadota bacterium]